MTTVPAERKASVRQAQEAAYDVLHPKFLAAAEALMSAEAVYSAKCPNPKCGRSVNVKVPELRGFLDLWKFYDERVAGKPANQAEPPRAVDPGRPLAELSDDELYAVMAQASA